MPWITRSNSKIQFTIITKRKTANGWLKITGCVSRRRVGIPHIQMAIRTDSSPGSFTIIWADKDIQIRFIYICWCIRFGCKMITRIIKISCIISCNCMERTTPLNIHIPLIHFRNTGIVPNQRYSIYNVIWFKIRISNIRIFWRGISSIMSDRISCYDINSLFSCNRRRSDLCIGPDEFIICSGCAIRSSNSNRVINNSIIIKKTSNTTQEWISSEFYL